MIVAQLLHGKILRIHGTDFGLTTVVLHQELAFRHRLEPFAENRKRSVPFTITDDLLIRYHSHLTL